MVPQTGQAPFTMARPLAVFSTLPCLIARFWRHLTQYPSKSIVTSPFIIALEIRTNTRHSGNSITHLAPWKLFALRQHFFLLRYWRCCSFIIDKIQTIIPSTNYFMMPGVILDADGMRFEAKYSLILPYSYHFWAYNLFINQKINNQGTSINFLYFTQLFFGDSSSGNDRKVTII